MLYCWGFIRKWHVTVYNICIDNERTFLFNEYVHNVPRGSLMLTNVSLHVPKY